MFRFSIFTFLLNLNVNSTTHAYQSIRTTTSSEHSYLLEKATVSSLLWAFSLFPFVIHSRQLQHEEMHGKLNGSQCIHKLMMILFTGRTLITLGFMRRGGLRNLTHLTKKWLSHKKSYKWWCGCRNIVKIASIEQPLSIAWKRYTLLMA